MLISFFGSLAIILFVRTNVISVDKFQNQSVEPHINKGALLFYQPNFYNIQNNDLIIIKKHPWHYVCKVLSVNEQSYKLEMVSNNEIQNISKDEVAGKIVYIMQ